MNRKSLSVSVGLFVILIITMTFALVLFLNVDGFSRKAVQRYQVLFDSSIKGLNVGAPVTLRGVKIGEVVTIKTRLYHNHQKVLNVVTIDMYPDAISEQGKSSDHNVLGQLLKQGLSAQIGLQSVLTGLLYIEVDFFDSFPEMQPVATEYPQIPTVPNNLEEFIERFESINIAEMASSLTEVLDNLSRLTGDDRLNKLIDDVDKAFVSMTAMSNEMASSMAGIRSEFASMSRDAGEVTALLKTQLPAATQQLNETMLQLQQTMSAAEETLAPDSPLMYQLTQSSKDISRASRAVDDLADLLQRQPDSIIFGRQSGDVR
ncbi:MULTISPECIES: MlaD family protein [Gammaproteobacteria]|uniref:MlaD family protein n=1 Tax=Gammaproteobacteria TaxID=1236 RepID=UPI001ADCBA0B|nr:MULTISPECIES: MlaD family protein [Gammaproteobacteria]MBO9483618.1 MCE family protein [Salinisphaera sp. G21_0]MBO9496458.1 MCE family protein [Thalassotalea sp. G20_0]